MNDDMAVPDLEMFFGVIYKAFCGKCGRMLFTGGSFRTEAAAAEQVWKCQHCGCKVKWEATK